MQKTMTHYSKDGSKVRLKNVALCTPKQRTALATMLRLLGDNAWQHPSGVSYVLEARGGNPDAVRVGAYFFMTGVSSVNGLTVQGKDVPRSCKTWSDVALWYLDGAK